jgi:rSAM/selenodomain-associated transferase 1
MYGRCVVCVFAKPPRPGEAKTRLAATIGEVSAAELARAFLQDTFALVSSLTWARTVIATTDGTPEDLGLPGRPSIWFQGDGDLGERLERILRRALAEADVAIAIGADTPGLPERLLVEAARALANADAVLGPSEDGGFYLLGLKECPEGLLAGLPWSERTTSAATLSRLLGRGLAATTLEPWFDVDRPEDLERLRSSIDRGATHAPATARLLSVCKGLAR